MTFYNLLSVDLSEQLHTILKNLGDAQKIMDAGNSEIHEVINDCKTLSDNMDAIVVNIKTYS